MVRLGIKPHGATLRGASGTLMLLAEKEVKILYQALSGIKGSTVVAFGSPLT